jgi:hypothetical protein
VWVEVLLAIPAAAGARRREASPAKRSGPGLTPSGDPASSPDVLALAPLLALAFGAAPALALPLGGGALPLGVGLAIETTAGGAETPPLAWSSGADGAWIGACATERYDAEVALVPDEGGARSVALRVRWKRPVALERLSLTLRWPGAPWAVGRTLAWAPVAGRARVERGTPLLVEAGGAVLAGGPGWAAAEVARAGAGVEVRLVLDEPAARPFSTYEDCLDALPIAGAGQHVSWAALERRRPLAGAPRAAGEEDRARAKLYPRGDGPFVPVVLERWPAGARAAVVFTDHADRTDPDALRAVLYGDSDRRAEGRVGAGFLGRGLALTRSFFVHARGGALEDPEVQDLADALAAAGSEVSLHSITPDRDPRGAVAAGLAAAARWRPATWIDHEPYTNCEALSSRGGGVAPPWGIRDLLVAAGVRWVWAAGDLGSGATRVVNLLGGAADEARAAVFPLPLDPRLWVFRSTMFYDRPAALAAALSDAALEALEAERGLFVAHTYLAPAARTTHTPDHLARLAVREAAPGRLVIDPDLDAALARLAARAAAGRLASLTWVETGDRLRALGDVEVAYRADGAAEIRNLGEAPLAGLTVALPAAGLDLDLTGALLAGREDDGGWTRLWFDLPPGGRAVLRASDAFVPVPLLPFR